MRIPGKVEMGIYFGANSAWLQSLVVFEVSERDCPLPNRPQMLPQAGGAAPAPMEAPPQHMAGTRHRLEILQKRTRALSIADNGPGTSRGELQLSACNLTG